MDAHERELMAGERFDFGANWQKFLSGLSEADVTEASRALLSALGVSTLAGKSFLDVGSGSGLSSLAAHRAGARVVSFDFDPRSVACTGGLRTRSGASDTEWQVLRGSVLDAEFLSSLGQFDVVYSWGVLHHTGDMWRAVDRVAERVAIGGRLVIALYNDQGVISRYWYWVKKTYNRSRLHSYGILVVHAPYFLATRLAGSTLRLIGRRRETRSRRGMHFWRDVIDWLGGYPFEVAGRQEVVRHVEGRGFELEAMNSVGRRHGCNEWVFRRKS